MAGLGKSGVDEPPPSMRLGLLLGGKYRIDSLIAEGGMSFVYLARDTSLDERVAVKILKWKYRQEKDLLARFLREAKTIRRIQSDHCVKVHEVDLDAQHGPFIVMEYLEGRSLRGLLTRPFSPRRTSELTIQVCDALAAAHAIGCIHRDIKPDNIVILMRGDLEVVRVLDFGISKHALTGSVLDQDLALVNTLTLMGTPTYMSPEQMRSSELTDPRTDIWATGAMLYEMVAGRPPFVSDSVAELCSMVLNNEPPHVTSLAPKVPEALARVIHKCLQKAPKDRYQNVGELAVALMEFAPRRARASVERILATLAAAGVSVDRSHVSDHPPSDMVDLPPMPSIPNDSLTPTLEQPDGSRAAPTVMVAATKRRLVLWFSGVAAAVGLLFWAAVLIIVRLRAPAMTAVNQSEFAPPPPLPIEMPSVTETASAAPPASAVPSAEPATKPASPVVRSAPRVTPIAPPPAAKPPPPPPPPASRPKVLD